MAEKVTIKGIIVEAKYFREERSIAVVVRDTKTGKVSKPIQISSGSFRFRPDQDIDDEMQKTAELMNGFKHPVNLVFAGEE